mmetsp:Transcript_14817/g.17773  ORF Transcript_14817/g.17773 Transcript_14817/m.17773 type:complete len:96 (-) Transcript_14817:2-289(-)
MGHTNSSVTSRLLQSPGPPGKVEGSFHIRRPRHLDGSMTWLAGQGPRKDNQNSGASPHMQPQRAFCCKDSNGRRVGAHLRHETNKQKERKKERDD